MIYSFTYTVSSDDEVVTRNFSYDCDAFNVALCSLARELINIPAGSSIVFNTYYRANRDYRKFREREAFELLFNGLNSRGVLHGCSQLLHWLFC